MGGESIGIVALIVRHDPRSRRSLHTVVLCSSSVYGLSCLGDSLKRGSSGRRCDGGGRVSALSRSLSPLSSGDIGELDSDWSENGRGTEAEHGDTATQAPLRLADTHYRDNLRRTRATMATAGQNITGAGLPGLYHSQLPRIDPTPASAIRWEPWGDMTNCSSCGVQVVVGPSSDQTEEGRVDLVLPTPALSTTGNGHGAVSSS